jgi:hypothetical protein
VRLRFEAKQLKDPVPELHMITSSHPLAGTSACAGVFEKTPDKTMGVPYVYKPSGRQADEVASIARELSQYSREAVGLSDVYLAISERAVAEYKAKGHASSTLPSVSTLSRDDHRRSGDSSKLRGSGTHFS